MRRHLGERGFLAALSDGAGTTLPDLVKEFVARCGRLQPTPDPDPGRNPNVPRGPLMSATSDRDAATAPNRSLATARPDPRAAAKPRPRPDDRTAHPYAGPPDADRPTLPPAPGCGGPLPGDPLTPRQSQVSALITLGLSNKQIARRLQISEWTVVNH
ncbi:LuxR C-terminal-related transcriptional regulator, partial [Streptomyces sp. 2MCAF27]